MKTADRIAIGLTSSNLNLTVPLVRGTALGSLFCWSPLKGKTVLATIMTLGVLSPSEMRLGFALGFIGLNVCQACGSPTMKSVGIVLNK